MSPSLAPPKLLVNRELSKIKSRNSMLGPPSPQLLCCQAGKCQVWEGLRRYHGGAPPCSV